MEIEHFITEHIDKPWQEIARLVNDKYDTEYNGESLRSFYRRHLAKGGSVKKKVDVNRDLELLRTKEGKTTADRKVKEYIRQIAKLNDVIESFEKVKPVNTFTIKPRHSVSRGEATVVVLASDWHVEECVRPETINGLNEHNMAIAKQRATEFFQASLRLTQILQKDVEIKTMILALLGDFITGDIHEEMMETSEVEPVLAIIEVQKWIASGIQFILDNSELSLVIPCHSGNHARTTKETRYATEAGHSLEYLMYHMLADHFRGNKRVKFIIPRSYHSFVRVYDDVIRFHHGHMLRYGGGVGGLTIPVNKAIAQWNKSNRDVTIDCFGHWHTRFDGGNFIANGSNIGFNAFAVAIKASYDKPSQTLFLIDKKRSKTCVWPILYSV